jgi:hypothetical protein
MEKTQLKIIPNEHRYFVQKHLFSFAQQGFSQSGKAPQGGGTLSKPRDTEHTRPPIAGSSGLTEQEVDPRLQRFPITKPTWGCYEEMHPKKPRHSLEPGSYKEAVHNLKTEILLDHSKERLSLADQDLVFAESERVFCETLTGGELLLQ